MLFAGWEVRIVKNCDAGFVTVPAWKKLNDLLVSKMK